VTGAEFVRLVMRRLDCSSPADLAEAMKWKRGTERTVAKWLAGETRPSFNYVMQMVESAELVSTDEAGPKPVPAPRDPLAKLEATVDQMAGHTAEALQELQREVKELSTRIPPAVGRHRRSA
jgi:hypothetical protein